MSADRAWSVEQEALIHVLDSGDARLQVRVTYKPKHKVEAAEKTHAWIEECGAELVECSAVAATMRLLQREAGRFGSHIGDKASLEITHVNGKKVREITDTDRYKTALNMIREKLSTPEPK